MREYNIGKNDAGQRLDGFLAKVLPGISSSVIQKYIREKRIKRNGARTQANARLEEGDRVNVYVYEENLCQQETKKGFEAASGDVCVVFEDENILLADKPAGLLVHDGDGETSAGPTLIDHIQSYLYKNGEWDPKRENSFAPSLCNRIDRNTCGIVVSAKNAEALRILNEKIKGREMAKEYLCVICGRMDRPSGRLEDYLRRDLDGKRVYVTKTRQEGARTAVLSYKTVSVTPDGRYSLLLCRLITGRTHQIRAQFAFAGHPLLGDGKYGDNAVNRAAGRKIQALCAWRLTFRFKTPGGILQYLDGRTFLAGEPDFTAMFPGWRKAVPPPPGEGN